MLTLKCENCGKEKEFNDPEEAFREGWDCPPFFTQVISCPNCPTSMIILDKMQKWKKQIELN